MERKVEDFLYDFVVNMHCTPNPVSYTMKARMWSAKDDRIGNQMPFNTNVSQDHPVW